MMSVVVAGGHKGRQPYKVHRKLKGQKSTINASKSLILQKEEEAEGPAANSLSPLSNFSPKQIQTPLVLLFSPQSQGSVLAPNLPLLCSIPWI